MQFVQHCKLVGDRTGSDLGTGATSPCYENGSIHSKTRFQNELLHCVGVEIVAILAALSGHGLRARARRATRQRRDGRSCRAAQQSETRRDETRRAHVASNTTDDTDDTDEREEADTEQKDRTCDDRKCQIVQSRTFAVVSDTIAAQRTDSSRISTRNSLSVAGTPHSDIPRDPHLIRVPVALSRCRTLVV